MFIDFQLFPDPRRASRYTRLSFIQPKSHFRSKPKEKSAGLNIYDGYIP